MLYSAQILRSFSQIIYPVNSANSPANTPSPSVLNGCRQWLNNIEIKNADFARLLCELIPVQCPFARDINIFGLTVIRIPPLCKLNPLYEEVVSLRFRALCYLADICKEDVRRYC